MWISAGGAGGTDETGTNKDTHDIGEDAHRRTCLFSMSIFRNGTWLTQEPPCRFKTTWFQISCFARFSRSEWAASEQVNPSSKDVESPLHTNSHVESPNFSCQVKPKCFCTWDAFRISNSISYFWASVYFIPVSSRWYEPLGESLSRLKIDTLKRSLNLHCWIGNSST